MGIFNKQGKDESRFQVAREIFLLRYKYLKSERDELDFDNPIPGGVANLHDALHFYDTVSSS